MKKKRKGTMTVEAAVIIPLIIMMIGAQIYLLFFLHDSIILQSYGFRKAEQILWLKNNEDKIPVLMMETDDVVKASGGIFEEMADTVGSRDTANVQIVGRINILAAGIVDLTGEKLQTDISVHSVRVHYPEDRIKAVLRKTKTD